MAMFDSVVRRTAGDKAVREAARITVAREQLESKLRYFAAARNLRSDDPVIDLSNRLLQYRFAEAIDRKTAPAQGRQRARQQQWQAQSQPQVQSQAQEPTADRANGTQSADGARQPNGALEYVMERLADRVRRFANRMSGLDQHGDRRLDRLNNHALNEKVYENRYNSLRRLKHQTELAKGHPLLEKLSGDLWNSRSGFRLHRAAQKIDLNDLRTELVAAVVDMERKHGPIYGLPPVSFAERRRADARTEQVTFANAQNGIGITQRARAPQREASSEAGPRLAQPSPVRPWQTEDLRRFGDPNTTRSPEQAPTRERKSVRFDLEPQILGPERSSSPELDAIAEVARSNRPTPSGPGNEQSWYRDNTPTPDSTRSSLDMAVDPGRISPQSDVSYSSDELPRSRTGSPDLTGQLAAGGSWPLTGAFYAASTQAPSSPGRFDVSPVQQTALPYAAAPMNPYPAPLFDSHRSGDAERRLSNGSIGPYAQGLQFSSGRGGPAGHNGDAPSHLNRTRQKPQAVQTKKLGGGGK